MRTRLLVLGVAVLAAGVAALVVAQPPAVPRARPLVGAEPKSARPKPASLPKTSATDAFPTVGYLETRDRVVAIKAGPQGTVYTIQRKDGQVLHRNLSARALQAKAPELYQLLRHGLAQPKKTDKVVIDASVSWSAASGPRR